MCQQATFQSWFYFFVFAGTSPPVFKQNGMPPKEVSYKLSDVGTVTKTLPCIAEAEPPAS